MIQISNLTLRMAGRLLIEDASVTIPTGSKTGFVGRNGTGKTTLARGLLHGLGHVGRVKSPTYTLMETYRVNGMAICHLDLYRLADADELEYLGLRDYWQDDSLILVEWPEMGAGMLPEPDIHIRIEHRKLARSLSIEAVSPRARLYNLDLST